MEHVVYTVVGVGSILGFAWATYRFVKGVVELDKEDDYYE